ncbi:MAG: GAF domain-containing sensor histidine kinase [Candidatus Omnitrophica bacterium]|nr:GAF domain-containing sensor histidine kinase [Candidatus Omnitrophota bacterium]
MEPIINITLGAFAVCGLFTALLYYKSRENRQFLNNVEKLKHSFNELDTQAKLIVKTDLELNKTQEELDKRLNDLTTLQKISRLISTTLDETEIFQRLNQTLAHEIGFEKTLLVIINKDKALSVRVQTGFHEDEIQIILQTLQYDLYLRTTLEEGKSFSSVKTPKQKKDGLIRVFKCDNFVLTPILTQNGFIGVIFLGDPSHADILTQGDEETAAILGTQIGQALENARLFEEIFRSSKELESKVLHRTRELEEALKQVREASRKKSEFISSVSHELRTPLTSIKGYASILMAGKLGAVPEAVKTRLEKINTHSDNLVKLINELLDIARIESGRVEMAFVKNNFAKIIDNVIDLLTPQMRDKKIEWKIDMPPTLPDVLLDSAHMERALINILSNAIKFTPENGRVTVTGSLVDAATIKVEIADTGIGIPKDNLPKLFTEFYRADNAIHQNIKGTGLGLVLTKRIIEAHKGKIWVTSEIGKGTTFHLTLPVAPIS